MMDAMYPNLKALATSVAQCLLLEAFAYEMYQGTVAEQAAWV